MDECRCPYCKGKMVDLPELPFDNVACPKCNYRGVDGLMSRSGESAEMDWTCERCGHKWSEGYVLPKKFLARFK